MKVQNKLMICCAAVLLAAGAASAQEEDILALNDTDVYIATPVVQADLIALEDGSAIYVPRDNVVLNGADVYIVTPPTRSLRDDLIALENSSAAARGWGSRWPTYDTSSGVD